MAYGDRRSGGRGASGGGKPKQKFNLDDYIEVKTRIEMFVKDFPEGVIQTFIAVHDGPEIIFECRVYRTREDVKIGAYTSGFAREVEGKGNAMINGTSHAENSETSSVGRALANMGYATTKNRASRSEIVKVARMTQDHENMLEFISAHYNQIPEDAQARFDGEAVNLAEYIAEVGDDIKDEYKLCRQIVTAVEVAVGVKWGD